MDHYIDIKVLPDPEFKETVLMNALYAKLHRALGQVAQGKIGVSFPQFKKALGDTLRLHGLKGDLLVLMDLGWLKGLRDYTSVTDVSPVPAKSSYRTVRRVQLKSVYNKRKRSIAKGWLTEEQAIEKIPASQQKELNLPFAQLTSLSNRNPMRVYIEHGDLIDESVKGLFGSYGLSAKTTIPWF